MNHYIFANPQRFLLKMRLIKISYLVD